MRYEFEQVSFEQTKLNESSIPSPASSSPDSNLLRVQATLPGRRHSDNTIQPPRILVAPCSPCTGSPLGYTSSGKAFATLPRSLLPPLFHMLHTLSHVLRTNCFQPCHPTGASIGATHELTMITLTQSAGVPVRRHSSVGMHQQDSRFSNFFSSPKFQSPTATSSNSTGLGADFFNSRSVVSVSLFTLGQRLFSLQIRSEFLSDFDVERSRIE